MAKKYYAVKCGRIPGVYDTWDSCKMNVNGYPNAVYKSFPTREEAVNFVGTIATPGSKAEVSLSANCAVSSGSKAGSGLSANGAASSGGKAGSGLSANGAASSCSKAGSGLSANGAASSGGDVSRLESAIQEKTAYAFVDGSYNIATKVYGFGGFLVDGDQRYVLQGNGKDPEMASMRNVAGEILGSRAAVEKAVELGLKEIRIYYDYMGIEMWAIGAWKRNKSGTIAYYDYMQSVKDKIHVSFVKVKGHSGVEGNEEADRLAKEAVGNMV